MAGAIPPPPTGDDPGSYRWTDWYNKLVLYLNNGSSIPWAVVDKSGSDLQDLAARSHASLQNVQGSTAGYHISAVQYAAMPTTFVSAFNTRTGGITLTSADVTGALGYTPANLVSPAFTTSIGFNGTSPITKPTVTGAKGGNLALTSLLTALASYGLITDSTT